MLGRQAAPVVVGEAAAVGDGDQRVVRLRVGAACEVHLVGGDERDASAVGKVHGERLVGRLAGGVVALHLAVEPVAEGGAELGKDRRGSVRIARRVGQPHGPVEPTRQREDVVGPPREVGERHRDALPVR